MSKKLLYLFSLIYLLTACGGGTGYQIEGKLTNIGDESVYAVFESPGRKLVDTIFFDKPGVFKIFQKESEYQLLTIFYNKKQSWIPIYLEPGVKITVSGDALFPELLQVKGGEVNDKLSEFKKSAASLLKERGILLNSLDSPENNPAPNAESDMLARLRNVNHEIREQAAAFVNKHPGEKASAVLIQDYFADADNPRKMDELLAVLDPKIDDFYLVKELKQLSEKAQRTVVGASAPPFSIHDLRGNPVLLDSLPKSFLLLTFTAPWCEICQSEEVLLDEIAKKYTADQLQLMMIALEEDAEETKGFVKGDTLRWTLVSDIQGEATSMIELYNVSALPRCFLIDQDRKIVLKTESGVEIKKKLEELID